MALAQNPRGLQYNVYPEITAHICALPEFGKMTANSIDVE